MTADTNSPRAVATVTECEACFTPDTCQLRGTCDHYSAEQMRVARVELLGPEPEEARPVAPAGWMPIETAPDRGTVLLAAEFDGPGDWRIKVGYRDRGPCSSGGWYIHGASWKPTHWMPLPAAPGASPAAPAPVALSEETVIRLRSKYGWAKETIRAIEQEILRAHGIKE